MPETTTGAVPRPLLYAFLGCWGGLTMLRQMDLGRNVLARLGWFGVTVPNYRFFGPIPVMHDLHILVRDKPTGERVGPWRELDVVRERRPLHTLWAPHRRVEKGLIDVAKEMTATRRRSAEATQWKLAVPYLVLLNIATYGVSHEPDARQTQFAIVRAAEYEPRIEPETLFVSDFHDLDAGADAGGPRGKGGR